MINRKLNCIVIDDDGVLRSLISSILRRQGFEILAEATQAEAGLNLCREHQPRLVLLDINLPARSGLEILPEILAQCPQTRVIIVTGDATMDTVRSALSLGASGFVVKPFTSARLLDAVGRSLGLMQ